MTSPLADAIRAHCQTSLLSAYAVDDLQSALLAVLDTCEEWRPIRFGPSNESVGADVAAEFEQTIARALGIEVPS
jgi:hypothetical protein